MKNGEKPLLIGITSDFEPEETGRHARFFLKEPYVRYISSAGAIPLIIPSTVSVPVEAWGFLDGLILSGSGLDISPDHYGQDRTFWENTLMAEDRVRTEIGLLKLFEKNRKPVFGICGGFQMINVYRGGTLIEDLPSSRRSSIEHREGTHPIALTGGIDWIPSGVPPVNSFHHQGIDRLGDRLIPFAQTPDHMVEGFIDPELPFFAGVQWHPERQEEHPLSRILLSRFLETASRMADREA